MPFGHTPYLNSSSQMNVVLRGAGVYKIPIQGWTTVSGSWGFTYGANYIFYSHRQNMSPADGDENYVEVFLPAGDYKLYAFSYKGTDRGIMEIYADATLIVSSDLYAGSGAVTQPNGTFTVASDKLVKLTVKVNGKNASSSDYRIMFGELAIVRTG